MRWWRITLRNVEGSMYPGEIKDTLEDFRYDEVAHREIYRIFGPRLLDYCLNLVQGKIDWLVRLPTSIQIKIFSFLNLDDIPQLSLVCKNIRVLCRSNDLWKIFYARHYGRNSILNRDLISLAERQGWRHVFFTNRIKLQMQLRRESKNEHREDPSDVLKSHERRSKFQPSPPVTARIERPFSPTIRRHSFANRNSTQPETSLVLPSPRKDRLYSPSLTDRSNFSDQDQTYFRNKFRPNSRN